MKDSVDQEGLMDLDNSFLSQTDICPWETTPSTVKLLRSPDTCLKNPWIAPKTGGFFMFFPYSGGNGQIPMLMITWYQWYHMIPLHIAHWKLPYFLIYVLKETRLESRCITRVLHRMYKVGWIMSNPWIFQFNKLEELKFFQAASTLKWCQVEFHLFVCCTGPFQWANVFFC